MSRSRYSVALLIVAALTGLAFLSQPAFAGVDPNAVVHSNCYDFVGLTNRLAGCLRQTIDASAATFFNGMYPMLQKAIGAIITLAVVIYGVMLSQGLVERVGRDTIILLFKVAAVTVFTTSSPFLYGEALTMMDRAAQIVVSYAPPSGPADNSETDFTQSKCMQNMIEMQEKANEDDPDRAKPVVGPWLGIDCLLDSVIGIKVPKSPKDTYTSDLTWFNPKLDAAGGGNADNTGMSRTYWYLFFSGAQTSTIGFVFAFVGFVVVYGLLMLIVKAFFTYIAGYMGVALMIIVSPLFIPLILFHHTRIYFDKWVKVTISFAVQPIIMMVFITFSLTAIDFATFSGKYSITYAIAGEATKAEHFDLNKYLSAPRDKDGKEVAEGTKDSKAIINNTPRTLMQVKADNPTRAPADTRDVGGVASGAMNSMCTADKIAADTGGTLKKVCGYQYPVSIMTKAIDWEMMAKARMIEGPEVVVTDPEKTGQQICREVLASIVFCAVVIFVMNGLMSIVPFMAYDLLGDFAQSPNIGAAEGSGFTGGGKLASSFTNSMKQLMGKGG